MERAKSMTSITEQQIQVSDWLEGLSHRKVCALACQYKIMTWANKTKAQLVKELERIPAVQQTALEMIYHGEGVQSG